MLLQASVLYCLRNYVVFGCQPVLLVAARFWGCKRKYVCLLMMSAWLSHSSFFFELVKLWFCLSIWSFPVICLNWGFCIHLCLPILCVTVCSDRSHVCSINKCTNVEQSVLHSIIIILWSRSTGSTQPNSDFKSIGLTLPLQLQNSEKGSDFNNVRGKRIVLIVKFWFHYRHFVQIKVWLWSVINGRMSPNKMIESKFPPEN